MQLAESRMDDGLIGPKCYSGAASNARLPQHLRLSAQPLNERAQESISNETSASIGRGVVPEYDSIRNNPQASGRHRPEERGRLALGDETLQIAHHEQFQTLLLAAPGLRTGAGRMSQNGGGGRGRACHGHLELCRFEYLIQLMAELRKSNLESTGQRATQQARIGLSPAPPRSLRVDETTNITRQEVQTELFQQFARKSGCPPQKAAMERERR
jgi:hypothetical protein